MLSRGCRGPRRKWQLGRDRNLRCWEPQGWGLGVRVPGLVASSREPGGEQAQLPRSHEAFTYLANVPVT